MPSFPFAPLTIYPAKSNGNAYGPNRNIQFGLDEANEIRDALLALNGVHTSGHDYVELRNMLGSLPDLSAAGNVRGYAVSGRPVWSFNAGAAKGFDFHNQKVINLLDYGVNIAGGGSSSSNSDKIDAAIADWKDTGRAVGATLLIPPGDIKIARPPTFHGVIGGLVQGAGARTSRLIWDGSSGADCMVVADSQFMVLRDFSVFVPTGKRARRILAYEYTDIAAVQTGQTLQNVVLEAADVEGCDNALWFSSAYGNNSEFMALACTFINFKIAGVKMPGSQQKSMAFIACQANGGWDGHTGHAGGLYALTTDYSDEPSYISNGGGAFLWLLGGVSSCRQAAFAPVNENDPMLVWGVQSENCYRFLGPTLANEGAAPTVGRLNISLLSNRIDASGDHAEDVILYNGAGPFECRFNNLYGAPGAKPKVRIVSGARHGNIVVRNNMFLTPGASDEPGVLVDTSVFAGGGQIDVGDNEFLDSGGAPTPRIEAFDVSQRTPFTLPAGVTLSRARRQGQQGGVPLTLQVVASAISIAGTSKDLHVFSWPRAYGLRSLHIYGFNYFDASGLAALSLQWGNASGLSNFLVPYAGDSSAGDGYFVGNDPAHLGSLLSGAKNGFYLESFQNPTELWLRAVSSGANLNTLTRGYFFVELVLEEIPRFVPGA